jgi:predicted dehydrogenase
MIKIGMVGVSPGNGHPFSFSAIINGYDREGLANSGWDVIYEYVRRRDPSEVGFEEARVSHVWTQDAETTRKLQAACRIPHTVDDPHDFVGKVDAVIIARDDYDTHAPMALPLLEVGLPVFVDKPLTVDVEELSQFLPYLEQGKLMSCSGLRFARELDEPRANIDAYGTIRYARGAVLNNWEQYGIHMLEALLHVLPGRPVSVTALKNAHDAFAITLSDGATLQIDALGRVPKTFQADIWGTDERSTHEINDNFTAFRRTLWRFVKMIRSGEPAINPDDTVDIIKTLIAGRRAKATGTPVKLNEITR